MPIYIYSCPHETKELLISNPPVEQKCTRGCAMTRNYHAERAGLPPFKAFDTNAFPGGVTHITTRDQEAKLQKKYGFVRVK